MDHFIFYNTSFTKLLFPLDPKSCSILSRIEIVPIVSIIGEEAWKKLLARENRWNSSIRISIGGLMGRIATLAGNVQSSAISRALVPFSLGSRIPGPKWALTKGLRGREKVEGKWESPRNEPGNRKYYVQLECRQPYAALCATCHENRLKPPCNLSFSLVLFFKRNLFSFATKTRLIWNLDFKNNFIKIQSIVQENLLTKKIICNIKAFNSISYNDFDLLFFYFLFRYFRIIKFLNSSSIKI